LKQIAVPGEHWNQPVIWLPLSYDQKRSLLFRSFHVHTCEISVVESRARVKNTRKLRLINSGFCYWSKRHNKAIEAAETPAEERKVNDFGRLSLDMKVNKNCSWG